MVEVDGIRFIVDCGPDFRQQMLRFHVDEVDAILITHGHKDHIGGLDDVRAFNYFQNRPTDVFASMEVQEAIRRDFEYAFRPNKYPGVPEIVLHTIENQPFQAHGISITPVKARHYDDLFVFGFRIGDFTYITDAVELQPAEIDKIKGSKVLVINALRKRKHYSHFNLEEALKVIQTVEPEQAYLTHISHQLGTYEEVMHELPNNVMMAFDGLVIKM